MLVLATSWFRRFINRRLREEKALRDSESFARATVDALPTSIAILDGYGEILSINRAWRDFAAAHGAGAKFDLPLTCAASDTAAGAPPEPPASPPPSARVNYLAVCDALSGRHMPDAGAFAAGIRAVAEGHRDEFGIEYEWPPGRRRSLAAAGHRVSPGKPRPPGPAVGRRRTTPAGRPLVRRPRHPLPRRRAAAASPPRVCSATCRAPGRPGWSSATRTSPPASGSRRS